MDSRTSRNTPYITNVEKEVYRSTKKAIDKRENIRHGPGTKDPALTFELYEKPKPVQPPTADYSQYMADLWPNKKFSPAAFKHLFKPTAAASFGPNMEIPMQQVYNINLPGPTGGHVEMNKIYENILPKKDGKLTANTLGERLQTYDFVRQILIRINDGEEISIDSSGHNSLLSYIKFMELNPNYYSPITDNPYSGLPYGLLIYRSCFPIKMDERSQSVACGDGPIGLNIRIYSLSYSELYSYRLRQPVYKEYDVWRELSFYEYLRENIIKTRQSPNFPLLYAFFMCPNENIDFFKLKKHCVTQKQQLTEDYKRFVQVHTALSKASPGIEVDMRYPRQLIDFLGDSVAKLPDEINPTLQAYSGSTMILVTESPHHNLYQWASRKYRRDGIVEKMTSHGYHSQEVWMGVLFQIIQALYVLQIHGIYIRDMTIADNIYIKDLGFSGKPRGYWKYIVDDMTFYVPNYGYVVMIDSNYKDIYPTSMTADKCKREYKIYTSNIFGKRYGLAQIRKKVYDNYKTIINSNSFTKEYTQNGVTRPPVEIMRLIDAMMTDPQENLGKVLAKYFRPLMHNRIGTLLKRDIEIPHIRDNVKPKVGDMVVEVLGEDLFKWCLVSEIKNNGIIEVISKEAPDSSDHITKDIRIESIKGYSSSETPLQLSIGHNNFSEESLLDTYIVSNT